MIASQRTRLRVVAGWRTAHPPGRQLMQHAMTGTARLRRPADSEAMAPPSGHGLGLE
jgi:hypothetical protein